MILVLAGTQDGRELACALNEQWPNEVIASVVSSYGGLLAQAEGLKVRIGALNESDLIALCKQNQIEFCVDASHPYAQNITALAASVCSDLGIYYIRYERPKQALPDYPALTLVADPAEAAKVCAQKGGRVFLTTGSRSLKIFIKEPDLPVENLIVRVLPDPKVVRECADLGLLPRQIIAMQGPFSYELNKAMFFQTQARVMVTKNSGTLGGTDTKLTAARELGLEIIVIDRPGQEPGQPVVTSWQQLKDLLESLRKEEGHGRS